MKQSRLSIDPFLKNNAKRILAVLGKAPGCFPANGIVLREIKRRPGNRLPFATHDYENILCKAFDRFYLSKGYKPLPPYNAGMLAHWRRREEQQLNTSKPVINCATR